MFFTLSRLKWAPISQCIVVSRQFHQSSNLFILSKLKSKYDANIEERKKKLRSLRLANPTDHKVIYKFPLVSIPAAFIKVRIPLIISGIFSAPVYYLMDSAQGIAVVFVICVNQFILSLLVGKLVEKLIGTVYVNKGQEIKEVIISSLDSNGRRVEKVHHPNDVIYMGFPNQIGSAFKISEVSINNTELKYKLCLIKPIIYDKKSFYSLFGDVNNDLNESKQL